MSTVGLHLVNRGKVVLICRVVSIMLKNLEWRWVVKRWITAKRQCVCSGGAELLLLVDFSDPMCKLGHLAGPWLRVALAVSDLDVFNALWLFRFWTQIWTYEQ